MEKLLLHKNKPETFKCQFNIDGVKPEDTVVRLCLEFDNNKNLFFYGRLDQNGNCEIPIPTLKEVDRPNGKLLIEAIADNTYFKVYEATVELKNSVSVKMVKKQLPESSSPARPASINVTKATVEMESAEPPVVEEAAPAEPEKVNPYICRKTRPAKPSNGFPSLDELKSRFRVS